MKNVDEETRKFVLQNRIDEMESDFYESPHRMAEEKSEDEYDFEEEPLEKHPANTAAMSEKKLKKAQDKLIKKTIKKKKNKKEHFLKRNLNLKKLLKEENLIDTVTHSTTYQFPNFMNTKSIPPKTPPRKFCSICGNFSKYKCPRCGERYCTMKCFDIHSEIMCLKFDNFA
jgi:zinc finger HIT domain-containing protein 1